MKKPRNSEKDIDAFLLANLKWLAPQAFPNGKPFGRLWLVENLRPGRSMWIDTRTGYYEVFAQAKTQSPDDPSANQAADA